MQSPQSEMLTENGSGDIGLIGDVGSVVGFGSTQLKGLGLVNNLAGTGAKDCPPSVRQYLVGYISQQIPADSKINPAGLIADENTAAVSVLGLFPAGAREGEQFDIIVSSLKGTETTSLNRGRLMPGEMMQKSSNLVQTKPLAKMQGALFIPENSDGLYGYVLNGGTVIDGKKVIFKMKKPDYPLISRVRDAINSKFGDRTAIAVSEQQINLSIPEEYGQRKVEFLKIINSIEIFPPENLSKNIENLIEKLKSGSKEEKERIKYRLIAIGKPAAGQVKKLLNSSDNEIRLIAAEILLTVGNYAGYLPLTEFAFDGNKSQQLTAIEILAWHGRRNDSAGVLVRLLNDNDIEVKLSAYEHLRRFKDVSISKRTIETFNGNFELGRIVQSSRQIIWTARSGQPRIALFGSPIYCRDNVFVESTNKNLIITSQPGQKSVTIVKTDTKTGEIAKISCSNELGIIISRLSQVPAKKKVNGTEITANGLGVSYSEMTKFINLMCKKGALKAEFVYGDEPEILNLVKIND